MQPIKPQNRVQATIEEPLEHLPAIEGEKQSHSHQNTEQTPQARQPADGIRLRFGQVMHHPLGKAIVLNLLLSSLLEEVCQIVSSFEEIVYQNIIFIGHNHFVLNRLSFFLCLA